MAKKPTHGALEKRVKELEKETLVHKMSEEELRQSGHYLQAVFDAIQDGLTVLDNELTVTAVNKWMEEKYASQMPLVGKKCYAVFQKRLSVCSWCPSVAAIERGESQAVVGFPGRFRQQPVLVSISESACKK